MSEKTVTAGAQVSFAEGLSTPLQDCDDAELMLLAKSGMVSAFELIVNRYQQKLVNFFRGMGVSINDANDLVQETFTRIYSYRKKYENTGSFKGFMYTTARNVWADLLRKRHRRADHTEMYLEMQPEAVHRDSVDVRIEIHEALSELSDKLRTVVVMRFFQGLKLKEISKVLGIPLGTVKSRMYLAMKSLHSVMSDEHEKA